MLIVKDKITNREKNILIETIQIIEKADTIKEIEEKVNNIKDNDDEPTVDIKIDSIIPKLEKLCNPTNMMNFFVDVLCLIEK